MLDRVEAAALNDLAELLNGLGDAGRREVARHLPAHLAERLRGGVEARWRVQELAPGYRLAGAACLGGAEQVASWLDRRELRRVPAAEADAVRVLSLIRDRPEEWRRDLAVRLVRRLRPVTGSPWRWGEQLQGWDLAAGLAIETGIEPPGNDAFVAGWVWRLAERQRLSRGAAVLTDDPLLDHLLPHLFQAQGVAEALAWNHLWSDGQSLIGELVTLAGSGRVPRRTLIDGCARRFLAGVEAAEAGPFVTLWQDLRPEPAEIPVADFVRVLPSASSPVVQLAVDELRATGGRVIRA